MIASFPFLILGNNSFLLTYFEKSYIGIKIKKLNNFERLHIGFYLLDIVLILKCA